MTLVKLHTAVFAVSLTEVYVYETMDYDLCSTSSSAVNAF